MKRGELMILIALAFIAGWAMHGLSVAEAEAEVYEAGAIDALAAVDQEGKPRKVLVDKYGRVYIADDVKWDEMNRRLERIERSLWRNGIR